jgi:septation ring formation regulator EzrA
VKECRPCHVFASFTLTFALQLRKTHGKTLSQVKKNLSQGKKNLSQVKKNLSQGKKNLSQGKKNLSQGKKNLSQVKKNLSQGKKNPSHSTVYILPKILTHYKTLTNTHITKPTHTHTHTHTHTLQNNIKPPQYKLKQAV